MRDILGLMFASPDSCCRAMRIFSGSSPRSSGRNHEPQSNEFGSFHSKTHVKCASSSSRLPMLCMSCDCYAVEHVAKGCVHVALPCWAKSRSNARGWRLKIPAQHPSTSTHHTSAGGYMGEQDFRVPSLDPFKQPCPGLSPSFGEGDVRVGKGFRV